MRTHKLLPAAVVLGSLVLMAPAQVVPAQVAPATGTVVDVGNKVLMFDAGFPISYVGVPVSITCPVGQGPRQFNAFVSQSGVSGSFGFVIAQCTGVIERFAIAVQSNFGTTYQEGDATATVTDFTTSGTNTVKIKRVANG